MKNSITYISENRWLILIIIVAAILRFYHLDFQSMWLDEIYTMNVANPNASFSTLIAEVNLREGFPYLYFIIIKTLHYIFGYEALVARSFSAIMGVASVYMIYRFGKQLFSKNVGLIAATLVTFSEYCIFTSQDARPYTFYFFAVLLSFYGLVAFLKERTLRNAIVYGIFSGILLNTNFFSVINLFSQSIILLFFVLLCPANERMKFLKNSILAGTIAILMFSLNYKLLQKMVVFKSGWIPAPTNESISIVFKELLGGSEITMFIFIALFFYFLINILRAKDAITYQEVINSKRTFSVLVFLPWVVSCILIIVLKSYLDTSLMVTRYFISILPVFFLIFAISFEFIANRILRFSVLITLVLFMLANNMAVRHYYTGLRKTQFREVASFVIKGNVKDEPVYTSLKYWYDYFFNKENAKFTVTEVPSLEVLMSEMMQDSTKIKAFWYVDAHGRPIVLSETMQKFADEKFYIESSFNGIDAWAKKYQLIQNKPTVDLSKLKLKKEVIMQSNVELFEPKDNILTISGWAYLKGIPSDSNKIELFLINESNEINVHCEPMLRHDVTSYFKEDNVNYDSSGFEAKINLTQIPKGEYKLAIYMANVKENIEELKVLDLSIKN